MRVAIFLTAFWALFLAGTSGALTLPNLGLFSLFKERITGLSATNKLEEFWDEAQQLGPKVGQVVLDEIVKVYTETTYMVDNLRSATNSIVEEARHLRKELETVIEQKNITMEHLSDTLSEEMGKVYLELTREKSIGELPKNRRERSQARGELVREVSQKVEKAYILAMVKLGVPSEQADQQFQRVTPKIEHIVLVIGNFIDDHPKLLELVIFSASMLLLPEIQILRPIMSMFGFGPLGPIRGEYPRTTAAWLQSRFWGGFVKSGSWFSILQRVGMTLTGSWIQRAVASLGLAAALGLVANKIVRGCN
ncbi:hypothetical protein NP233_g4776 [Leucocoprinus birnbaumii]|uniref:DUF148 domain-containing protein n=1 Tax=Leucocoprinus birnbaumii TaxID=56174 RepID=A0AAD5VU39_9AGAR|nr:hypothetical protein NP233_g4776 [Leucocoprinus birnbaumii]